MGEGTHLRDLVRALGWSYATIWFKPNNTTKLVMADGSLEATSLKRCSWEYRNVEELFESAYKACSFTPGCGYAGKVFTDDKPLWLTGSDMVLRHSNTSAQKQFFEVAGIRTLLCISLYNSVVELGSSALVPENPNLLLQIRAFMSHIPPVKWQQKDTNAFSPIEGPLLSPGLSGSADEASESVNQVESCLPLPPEAHRQSSVGKAFNLNQDPSRTGWEHVRLQEEVSDLPMQPGPVVHDLNETVVVGVDETDRRLGFGSPKIQSVKSSPSSMVEPERLSPCQTQQWEEDLDRKSSFISSPPEQMPLLSQLYYNQIKASSQQENSRSKRDIRVAKQPSKISGGFISKKLGAAAFKAWKSPKDSDQMEKSRHSNEVILQRPIDFTHRNTEFHAARDDKKAVKQEAITVMSRVAMEATELLSGHEEAAINHMLAERKRRQRQKDNFSALRDLIPFVSKMDRASILADAITYVKQLTSRIQELESLNSELTSQLQTPSRRASRSTLTSS